MAGVEEVTRAEADSAKRTQVLQEVAEAIGSTAAAAADTSHSSHDTTREDQEDQEDQDAEDRIHAERFFQELQHALLASLTQQ